MKKIIFALAALLGIVACENEPAVEPQQTLQLAADKMEITADGSDVATFTVKNLNDEVVEATIYFTDTNEALEGMTFKTKYAGEYKFYAKAGNAKSNEVVVVAKEATDTPVPPQPDELTLTVDNATIDADGTSTATFTTTLGGEVVAAVIYNAADDTALASNTFSTETVGVYTFYAMYEGERSNDVKVTAKMKIVEEEKPIVIEASVETIKANGIESATLIVTQDGANVTSKCTIYANGSIVNGNKFATTTAGDYVIYATKGDLKSNEITITATAVETGLDICFVDGVTLTSGWYDVNKMAAGDNGDTMMCWAAAASNMIQWWQDRYVAYGFSLPQGAVTGAGTKLHTGTGFNRSYELALMDVFHSQWTNLTSGSQADFAISWYFEGRLNGGEYASNQAKPTTAGGYFSSVWSSIYPELYHDYEDGALPWLCYDLYTTCFNNYTLWGQKSGNECLLDFSNYIVTAINRGIASLTIQPGSAALHAITLWGYEIDKATGLISRVWVTDSDDQITEPKQTLLNEYKVSVAGNKIKLNGTTRYGECTVIDVIPLSGYGSAE